MSASLSVKHLTIWVKNKTVSDVNHAITSITKVKYIV